MTVSIKPLKPCPFCGGDAERVDIDEGENFGGSCISCTRCMASSNVEFGFKENFVANWNRRAALAHDEVPQRASSFLPTEDGEFNGNALAHDEQAEPIGEGKLLETLRWAHDTLQEINPSNYTHDDVCGLNDASVEVILGIAPLIGEKHGKPDKWWAQRAAPVPEQASVPDGWKLVPIKPTEAMCRAGESSAGASKKENWIDGFYTPENVELIWRDMLAASPRSASCEGRQMTTPSTDAI